MPPRQRARLEEAEELLEKLFAPVTELRKLYESDLRKRDVSRTKSSRDS